MTELYWDEDDGQEGLLTRRSSEQCLTEQELEDFLFHRLSGVTREAVEEHLLFCQSCQYRAEEEERYLRAARSAAEKLETESLIQQFEEPVQPGASGRRHRVPPWMAAAAVAAVVLIGGSVAYRLASPADALEVELRAERSGVEKAVAPVAGQRLVLTPDLRGLPQLDRFHWSIVDSLGAPVAGGVLAGDSEKGRIELPKGLPAGMYWVRLLDPDSGVMLREYGLMVRAKGR